MTAQMYNKKKRAMVFAPSSIQKKHEKTFGKYKLFFQQRARYDQQAYQNQ